MPANDNTNELLDLTQEIKRLLDESANTDPRLRDALQSLEWRIRVFSSPPSTPERLSHSYGTLPPPEVIEAVTHVAVFVGGALVQNWIARADNKITQEILRRRRRRKPPTATQIKHFARFRLNVEWPAQIRASDDPHEERRGPEEWAISWVKGNVEFSASGDNDLREVSLGRRVLDDQS